MLNVIACYWLVGLAWFVVELTQGGGARHLVVLTRREAAAVPPHLLPLAALIVALFMVVGIVLLALGWPYWAWNDWRNGELFKPGRWDE